MQRIDEKTGYPHGAFAPGSECFWCKHRAKPGLVDRYYCANPARGDLVHVYGLMRQAPLDGGASCKEFDFDWRK